MLEQTQTKEVEKAEIAIIGAASWMIHGRFIHKSGLLSSSTLPILPPDIPIIDINGIPPHKALDKLLNKHLEISGVIDLPELLEELKIAGATITYSV